VILLIKTLYKLNFLEIDECVANIAFILWILVKDEVYSEIYWEVKKVKGIRMLGIEASEK
jgi:hypothetical protein